MARNKEQGMVEKKKRVGRTEEQRVADVDWCLIADLVHDKTTRELNT
jgi:hypothetical protein